MKTTFRKFVLLVFTHLLGLNLVHSQDFVYKNYGVNNGLPGSEVYHCFQDSRGYIWIGTDNGLCRYDGYDFVNYDIQGGLAGSTVSDIFEDKKGRIWFISLSGKLSYFENSKIHEYQYNELIQNEVKGYKLPVKQSFFVDSLDNVYLSVVDNGTFKITADGKLSNLADYKYQGSVYINHANSGKIINGYRAFKAYKNGIRNLVIDQVQINEVFTKDFTTTSLLFAVKGDKNEIYLCFSNAIYLIENLKVKKIVSFDQDVLWFSRDRNGHYWLSIRNHGMRFYEKPDFSGLPTKTYLPGKKVSSALVDRENGYWFSTLDEGVYYVATDRIKRINIPAGYSQNVTSVESISGNLYFGLSSGSLMHYELNSGKLTEKAQLNKGDMFTCLLYNKKWNKLILGTYQYSYILEGNKLHNLKYKEERPNKNFKYTKSIRNLSYGNGDYFYASTNLGFDKITSEGVVFESYRNNVFNRVINDLIENTDKSLWLATNEGLWKYENGEYKDWSEKDKLLRHRINALYLDNNTLYMATKGAGILMLDLTNDSVKSLNTDDGLSSNYISCISGYKNNIWIGTNKGINNIRFLTNNTFQISRLDVGNGLLSNEINHLVIGGNSLFIATKNGLNYINLDELEWNKTKPDLQFVNIMVNYKDTMKSENLELDYYQNNIQFRFIAISYKSNRDILYKYKLFPIENEWRSTYQTSLNYTTLPPGTYKLMLKARNESGVWSETIESPAFTIKKPFWKKWWFYLFMALTVIAFIYMIIYNRLQTLKRENRMKKELNDYMKKASMMLINDHFLFNSLNSLNLYVLSGDKMESSRMLTKISNYLRAVLNSIKKDFISLADEINTLNLYLEIEKQRLKDRFIYTLEVDKNLNTNELFIPGTFIQPFLESSIWAVTPENEQVIRLDTTITKENEFLIISIYSGNKNKDNSDGKDSRLQGKNSDELVDSIRKRAVLINDFYNWNIGVEYTNIDGYMLKIKLEMDKMKNNRQNNI